MSNTTYLISIAIWIAGIVVAKGFWSTLFAICIPFWAYYLVIEKVLITYGVI
jgi:hypothetical protein